MRQFFNRLLAWSGGRERQPGLPFRVAIEEGFGEDEEFFEDRRAGFLGAGHRGD